MTHVLIIQENGHHAENRDFRECFCLHRALKYHGVKAHVWGLGHDNYETVPKWDDYDLIINLENYDMTGWVPNLSEVKAKKFIWSIDAHVKGLRSYLMTAMAGKYDLMLQATPEFVGVGYKSVWFPNCYDDTLIKPLKAPKIIDVGFCGNVVNRGSLIAELQAKFDNFRFDEFVIGRSMVEAINSYKVHWNCNIGVDINYRNFETMGCGTFLITSDNKHYEQLGFIDEKNCYTYSSVPEMLNKIKHILKHDDYREELADNGYKLVTNYHTYKHRAQTILEYLDELN